MPQLEMFEDFVYTRLNHQLDKAVANNDSVAVERIMQDPVMRPRIADAADMAIEYEADCVFDVLLGLGLEDLVDLDYLAAHAAYCGKGFMVRHIQESVPNLESHDLYEALERLAKCGRVEELERVHAYVCLLDLDYGGQRLIRASLEGETLRGYEWLISIFKRDDYAIEQTYKYLLGYVGGVNRLEAALGVLLDQAPPNKEVIEHLLTLGVGSAYEDTLLEHYFHGGRCLQSDLPGLLAQAIRFNRVGAYEVILWHMDDLPPYTVAVAALTADAEWALKDLFSRGVGLDPETLKVTPEVLSCVQGLQFKSVLYLLRENLVAEEKYRDLLEMAVKRGQLAVVEEIVVNKGVLPIGLASNRDAIDQILRKHGATLWDLLEE